MEVLDLSEESIVRHKIEDIKVAEEKAAVADEPEPQASERPGGGKKVSDEKDFVMTAKRSLLMKHLGAAELKFVHTNSRVVEFEGNQLVYEFDQYADFFFMVKTGSFLESGPHPSGVAVPKRTHNAKGSTFGSSELLFTQPRRTTVMTSEEGGVAWAIPKRVFDSKIRLAPPPKKQLVDFLKSVPLFQKLSKDELTQLARAAVEQRLEQGAKVCGQGDAATCMYALRHGAVEAHQSGSNHKMNIKSPVRLLRHGSSGTVAQEPQAQHVAHDLTHPHPFPSLCVHSRRWSSASPLSTPMRVCAYARRRSPSPRIRTARRMWR